MRDLRIVTAGVKKKIKSKSITHDIDFDPVFNKSAFIRSRALYGGTFLFLYPLASLVLYTFTTRFLCPSKILSFQKCMPCRDDVARISVASDAVFFAARLNNTFPLPLLSPTFVLFAVGFSFFRPSL